MSDHTVNDADGNGNGNGEKARRRTIGLDAPTLGYIPPTPDTPSPVLADPMGDPASAYRKTVDRLQAAANVRVALVVGTDSGNGATLASLNLAMAAIRLGVKTVLIDGDDSGAGPSRFLRSGAAPGLTDLADGSVDLREASRLLELDADHQLPMIPAGSAVAGEAFTASDIADAVDLMSEHSDLLLICVPRDADDNRLAALGAHADASVLVVVEGDTSSHLEDEATRLADAGAPVMGIIELARRKRRSRLRGR